MAKNDFGKSYSTPPHVAVSQKLINEDPKESIEQAGIEPRSRGNSSNRKTTTMTLGCYWTRSDSKSSWGRLCGPMKMAKSCKEIEEDLGWKVAGSKLGASKDSSLWNLH